MNKVLDCVRDSAVAKRSIDLAAKRPPDSALTTKRSLTPAASAN
jgi:hypothetical protein